jgi:aminoglycoside 2'-N-acetyltransferase I
MGHDDGCDDAKDPYLSSEPGRLRRSSDEAWPVRSTLADRGSRVPLRAAQTSELSRDELVALRAMFDAVWGDEEGEFSDDDWTSAIGGTHFLVEIDGVIVSHASVVERVLQTGGRELLTGYVEAVATAPQHRRRGYATQVMQAVGSLIDDRYELGALGTGLSGFYERFGWEVWRGPTSVRTERGLIETPGEDGLVMIRRTPTTPALDLDTPISCDWRPGDVW